MNSRIDKVLNRSQKDRDKLCLKQLYQTTGNNYFKCLEVDSRIPYRLKADFMDAGHNFFGRLSEELANRVDKEISNTRYSETSVMRMMLKSASGVVTEHTQQLPGIIGRYDKEFNQYIGLQQANASRYLFVSEQGDNTCDGCHALHGKTFSLRDIPMPPLHPNCQCSVVALDNASSLVYDLNRQGFMSAVEVILRNSDGGIWTMSNSETNGNMRVGFVPFEIRPIAVSEEPTITDDTGKFPIIDSVINWARDFGEDAAEFLQQFWDSARQRADHRYDDFLSFWDWISSGIISGIWNSAEARAELMLSDPSLYNIINWLMLGLPDLIGRAFDPDKPLSFEHCLANLELVTILFGVYNVYQRHAGAMAAPMLDDPGMPHVSPDYDLPIIDDNKLNHIFGNPRHQMNSYLDSFGGDKRQAYYALYNATEKYVRSNHIMGVFNDIVVNVNGYNILVRGIIIDKELRIGTAFLS